MWLAKYILHNLHVSLYIYIDAYVWVLKLRSILPSTRRFTTKVCPNMVFPRCYWNLTMTTVRQGLALQKRLTAATLFFLATRRPSLSPCPYKGASHAGDTMGDAVTLCGEEQQLLLPPIQSSSQQLLSDQGHLNWSRHHMPSKITIFPRMLNGFSKKINL